MDDTSFEPQAQSKSENPEILSVEVSDDVKGSEAVGDTPKEPSIFDRYVPWTGTKARTVTEADVERVKTEALVLGALCRTPRGRSIGANAVAHNQIDSTDPLNFFVSASGEIIINPEIISHTKVPVDSYEGCTSFHDLEPKTVKRYHVITARFQQLKLDGTLSPVKEEGFSGNDAKVFQHEIAHLKGHSIYDETIKPEDAVE